MVGLDRAVLGGNGRAFDQRQQIALHALAADIGAARVGAGADLVDLVDEDDAVFLYGLKGRQLHGLIVQQLVGLFRHQQVVAFGHGHAAAGAAAAHLAEQLAQVDGTHLALTGGVKGGEGVGAVGHLDLDHGIVQLAPPQLAAEHLARLVAGIAPGDRLDHAFLGGGLRAGLDVFAHPRPRLDQGGVNQIADDAVNVAADIADFGELGRLYLEKGRAGQLGQTAADFGLAHAGGADHQDVLGVNLIPQAGGQTLAPPAVAQGDGDGAFRITLADDVAVKLGNDFARGQVGHSGLE